MEYEATIGLEVHVQLLTATKVFCGCRTTFGAAPNSLVCPVCLGMPGVLPVLNKRAFEYAIKTGLVLNCSVAASTKFDRKNYFYPDLPKNFQISQYDKPLSYDGYLDVERDGRKKKIFIKRVHLEEDAGKLIHEEDGSLVDFNRCGTPLLEIVTEPDINSADEAYNYLVKLKSILRYLKVSDCNMEEGSLRCDANISLRPQGESALGVKTEIKNMNSFKAVRQALEYEIDRQRELLENGEKIIQETRLWDSDKNRTFSMRSKEEAFDYRYFPEPDLPLFVITREEIEEIKKTLPELPDEKRYRFVKDYGLGDYDAGILTQEINVADYFEEVNKILDNPKISANWITGPLFKEANKRGVEAMSLGVSAAALSRLIKLVLDGKINITIAKEKILPLMIETTKDPLMLVEEQGLVQISDGSELEAAVTTVLNENQKSAQDYLCGKQNVIMFLVGQVMRKTKGKANPQLVRKILENKLNS